MISEQIKSFELLLLFSLVQYSWINDSKDLEYSWRIKQKRELQKKLYFSSIERKDQIILIFNYLK